MYYDIKKEFGKQARDIRLHFGLSQIDVANLSNMSASEYSDLENGTTNYNVEKIQSVSSVYGLYYYDMGNPKRKFPAISILPEKTKATIKNRKTPVKIYKDRLIIEHLTLILSELPKLTEFLIKDIDTKIIEIFAIKYNSEEISGTIAKNFDGFVIKTKNKQMDKQGRGAKPFYYKIIKLLPKKDIERAKDVLARYEQDKDENEDFMIGGE